METVFRYENEINFTIKLSKKGDHLSCSLIYIIK